MKLYFCFSIFLYFCFLSSEALAQEIIPAGPPNQAGFNQVDEFSGRTIEAGQMVEDLILTRLKNSPRVGEMAPDFKLYSLDRQDYVSLSELYRNKPVVLLFASWTCQVFIESALGLASISPIFRDSVDFVFVYIREAHPGDGDFGDIRDPLTNRERIDAARRFRKQMRLPFPILVDFVDDRAAVRWAAWPVRAYVIDSDGRVIYSGAQGPWGYRPYEGFLHGDGKWQDIDAGFNQNSLENFLNARFAKTDKKENR